MIPLEIIEAGDIVQSNRAQKFDSLLHKAIGEWIHDGGFINTADGWTVGESVPGKAKLTPVEDWNKRIANGMGVRILRATHYSRIDRARAAAWWFENVRGSKYDWFAYVGLTARIAWEKIPIWDFGRERDWYCTEGWRDAFYEVCGDSPWGDLNPTPETTSKALVAGRFEVVWQTE